MRRIGVEAMDTLADMRMAGEQTSFTTAEIAKRLGLEAWRVRRSLKALAKGDFTIVWSEGNDRWCIDPRYVGLRRFLKENGLSDEEKPK
jgi:DNA-binding IclR family transcriptional regulator